MPLGDNTTDLSDNLLQTQPLDFYASSITPQEIPLKQQEGYKSLLSSAQLGTLQQQERHVKDVAELYLQKNLPYHRPHHGPGDAPDHPAHPCLS